MTRAHPTPLERQWLDIHAPCRHCQRQIRGAICLGAQLQVVDSEGFMVFEDHVVCDACLKQRYGSDGTEIVDPTRLAGVAELFVAYHEGEEP